MKNLAIAAAVAALSGATVSAETMQYFLPNEDGMDYRLRNDLFYQDLDTKIGASTGTVGYVGDGRIFMMFTRWSVDDHLMPNQSDSPIPFEVLQSASSIVLHTGVTAKEYSRAVNDELGGVLTDWYIVPDLFNAPGYDLDQLTFSMWDVPNNPDAYFVTQMDPSGYVGMAGGRSSLQEEFNVELDVTAAVKQAIADGKLTAESTSFAIAAFPVEVPYWNAETQTYITDSPLHNPHRNWGFQNRPLDGDGAKGITYLEITVGEGPTWNGYEVRADGWAFAGNTANGTKWLGWVYVENDPWIYSQDLGKYIYVDGPSGWVWVPQN